MTDDFAPLSPDELWLCHMSCVSWCEPDRWARYFGRAEEILGTNITHLDKSDPVQRRVKPGKLVEVAEYLTAMGKREDSRWVLGRLEAIGVEFSVRHYRDVRGWPNVINWYFPAGFVDDALRASAIRSLFDCGNATLSPFYSYTDTKAYVAGKKKESGAVNIQAELLGVFWLSYFDVHYVAFIGAEKFKKLPDIHVKLDSGAFLDLGEKPSSVHAGFREQLETALGSTLFVKPRDMLVKRPGQYALTFDQLRA